MNMLAQKKMSASINEDVLKKLFSSDNIGKRSRVLRGLRGIGGVGSTGAISNGGKTHMAFRNFLVHLYFNPFQLQVIFHRWRMVQALISMTLKLQRAAVAAAAALVRRVV